MLLDTEVNATVYCPVSDRMKVVEIALPFLVLTVSITALPVLLCLLFHRRAQRGMPKARDWMNINCWLVNTIVCMIFIWVILV